MSCVYLLPCSQSSCMQDAFKTHLRSLLSAHLIAAPPALSPVPAIFGRLPAISMVHVWLPARSICHTATVHKEWQYNRFCVQHRHCMHLLRFVGNAQAVLKAIVRGGREHVVRQAQLLELPQPLKLRRVNDPHADSVQPEQAVHRILLHASLGGSSFTVHMRIDCWHAGAHLHTSTACMPMASSLAGEACSEACSH